MSCSNAFPRSGFGTDGLVKFLQICPGNVFTRVNSTESFIAEFCGGSNIILFVEHTEFNTHEHELIKNRVRLS